MICVRPHFPGSTDRQQRESQKEVRHRRYSTKLLHYVRRGAPTSTLPSISIALANRHLMIAQMKNDVKSIARQMAR